MAQSEVSGVARHTGIYFLGSILNRAASFILLPLYLKTLSTTEFGWLSIVLASMEVLALGLGLGIGNAMVRLLVECDCDSQRGRVIGSALVLFLLPATLVLALAVPAGQVVASYFSATGISPSLLSIGFAAVVFTVLFELILSVFRGLKQSWWYTFLSTGKSVLFLVLNTVFLLGFGWGVAGILWGTLISVALLSGIAVFRFSRTYPLTYSYDILRRLAKIGLPIIPGAVLDALFTSMDKFYLASSVNPAIIGIYALAGRLAQLLRIAVAAPFAQIWTVRRLEVETNPDADSDDPIFTTILLGYLMILLTSCVGLSLLGPEIIRVIGRSEYVRAADFIPFMTAGLFLYVLKWNFEIGIFAAEKTLWISLVSLITVLVALPVYSYIVPAYGAKGAAIAFVALGILRTAMTMFLANKVSTLARSFPSQETALLCMAAVASYMGARVISGAFIPFEGLGIRVLALGIFILFCALVGILNNDMRTQITSAIRKRIRT